MIKNLETYKAKMKESLLKTVDEHCAAFDHGSNQPGFDINSIESLMLEHNRKIQQILQEANAELAGNVETQVKKNARTAKPRSKEPSKDKS